MFTITKRIHHRLHGVDRGPLPDADEHATLLGFARENAAALLAAIGPEDLVVLHDPQTLAMAPHLVAAEVPTAWRCHIGTTAPSAVADTTWDYLAQFWSEPLVLVFSVPELVPARSAGHHVEIINPSIDPHSARNRPLPPAEIAEILAIVGLTGSGAAGSPVATVVSERPLSADPVLLQVSRWDPLKDMTGVLRAFVDSPLRRRADLVLCGPSPAGIVDDPEAAAVLDAVLAARDAAPPAVRHRIHLVCPDLTDPTGNDRLVNALQTRADVVMQKSLQEGFGLTVTEAMWKRRPVVATRVGGIPAQLVPGETGVLIDDPSDLPRFAEAVTDLLDRPAFAGALGDAAHVRVRDHFTTARELVDHHRLYGVLRSRALASRRG